MLTPPPVERASEDGGRNRPEASAEAKAAGDAATKRRVAEAQRWAKALVAEDRAAAEADAGRNLDEVAAQNEAERRRRSQEEEGERAEDGDEGQYMILTHPTPLRYLGGRRGKRTYR